MYPLSHFKLAFLGCGQMAQSLIQGYIHHSKIPRENILITGRNQEKTKRISEKLGVKIAPNNEELLDNSSVVFLCMKPFDGEEAIRALRSSIVSEHTFISVMAGISFEQLQKWGLPSRRMVRLMPNIPCRIAKGFLPFCVYQNRESLQAFIEELLKPLGEVLPLNQEELLAHLTVASSSGVGFFLEILEYWVEWLHGQGFSYEQARTISLKTFLGTGLLAETHSNKKFLELQKEVASLKGVTATGLSTMRELELERILRLSFEKASLREKELSLIPAKTKK